jgi:anthranilate synthase/aminodeoxychorismate synthase-like glutamine amidotransferase
MLLLIDNYDSFTFNLVQLLGELNQAVFVAKNDEIDLDDIKKLAPSHIVISPGPGVPSGAGITLQAIERFFRDIPILGVCLGFQAIAEVFGGKLLKAPKLFHGKTSEIYHNGRRLCERRLCERRLCERRLFEGVESPFEAMRYHSWIIDPHACDSEIEITAYTKDGIPMALQAKNFPLFGVQFHPESILTKEGKKIVRNFLTCCAAI